MSRKIKVSDRTVKGASGKTYTLTQKFNKWFMLVMDENQKETFGNFTRSAALAYGYDLADPTQYNTAYIVGRQNYEKLKDLSAIILDKRGISFQSWLDIAKDRMETATNPFWWIEIGDIMGFRQRKPTDIGGGGQQPLTQNNFFFANDEQRRTITKEAGVASIPEAELADVLIEGRDPQWEKDSVGLHN